MAEGFKIAEAYVQVSPNTDGFKEDLKAKVDEATAGVEGKVKVTLDTADLDAKANEAKAKVDELGGKTARPRADLDSADLDAKTDDAKGKLDTLDGKTARPRADLDAADLDAKADDAKAKVDDLGTKKADPKLGLDKADFDAKMDEAEARLEAFKAESASASLGASGGGGGGGGSGGGGSLAGLLGMGAASLLPGIGGAATGLGLLGGTGALAFGGIGQALSAQHQASQNVGITGAQQAATSFSNTVAIQNAQQQVQQAYQQSAQDAIASAQQTESAQSNLASVVRNAAASQIQAEQAVGQAQQGLETSNYGLSEAQYNLNQAWVNARLQLTSLNDALANSKLNTQQAALAVKEAEYQQLLTNQNAYSTDLQRQQAALSVAQAQQQLKDATDQQAASQVAANLANKQGVAGSQQVVQAKQAVVAAQFAQGNAQQAYGNAQRNLTLVELNNATQVKQAQLQVSAAQEQAAYTQMRDAQAVSIAQQNVTNTLKQQQLQQAATMSTANQAANQFARDMAKLTPAGRDFVNQILGMRGAWKQLESAAQNAVLPGATAVLTGISKLMPTITAGVSKMGGAIGGAFAAFGKQMQTPAFAKVLSGLIDNGIRFANIVLPAFGQFIGALAKVGSQKGAADGLANLLAGIARGMTGLTTALGPYIPQINSFLTAVGTIIAAIGPPLGRMVGLVATALGPLSRYLNAHPNGTVVKVIGDIVTGLLGLKALQKIIPDFIMGPLGKLNEKVIAGPLKKLGSAVGSALTSAASSATSKIGNMLAAPFQALAGKVGPMMTNAGSAAWGGISSFGSKLGGMLSNAAGSVASFVADFGRKLAQAAIATGIWIAEHAVATATFVAENVVMAASATAAFIAENAASLGLVAAIAGIVAAIVFLATHWKQVWTDIKNWALDAWHNVLEPVFHGIGTAAMWLYNNAIKPYFALIKMEFTFLEQAAMWMWHNVFDPLWQGLKSGVHTFVSDFGRVWSTLEGIFKSPVNFLINTVYDNGIAKLWNDVVGAIGLGSIKLPHIAGLAGGGVIPGYAPGHDTVPAMLSPGEAVLTPGAARAVGHDTIQSLNAAHRPAGTKPAPGHYAWGLNPISDIAGAAKAVGHGVSSFVGGALDIGKMVAAIATGNTTAFTNAAGKLIGTQAAGDLGKIMVGIPKTLVTDLAKELVGAGGGKGSAKSVNLPGNAQAWIQAGMAIAGVSGADWLNGLSIIAKYESGGNQAVVNTTDSNAQKGTPSAGLMQFIQPTFMAYAMPGHTSWMNPIDQVVADAWRGGYIRSRYGSIDNVPGVRSVRSGGGYVGYDSGGWMTGPPNFTGKPEAVLTPDESQAFVAIVKQLTSQGGAGTGGAVGRSPTVVQNYNGTMWPTAEQKASMLRDLALALGGA